MRTYEFCTERQRCRPRRLGAKATVHKDPQIDRHLQRSRNSTGRLGVEMIAEALQSSQSSGFIITDGAGCTALLTGRKHYILL
ncbi:hypothetical protein NQZ68_038023 [Dissostichus eleginoides]|nr:hypothetical protein NQZ68_038023 [Dissostichus eleginoides]